MREGRKREKGRSMKAIVNGKPVRGAAFAFNGTRGFYIIEDFFEEIVEVRWDRSNGTFGLDKLKEMYKGADPSNFIRNWARTETYTEA